MSLFGGLYFLFLLAIFWSVLNAAGVLPEKWTKNEAKKQKEPPKHMTLVELLVVIAIIGVLIVLLSPAVPSARGAAARMQCVNNMKQIAIAFSNYHDKYGTFPPAYTVDEGGRPLHSWRVLVLPYLENKELYEKIRLDEPWDSEHNRQFHSAAPKFFHCPSCDPRYRRNRTPPRFLPAPGACHYSVVVGSEPFGRC